MIIQAILSVVVICALTYFIILLSAVEGFDKAVYETEVAVALTIMIIGVGFWGFKPIIQKAGVKLSDYEATWGKNDEHEFEGKKKHTEDLKRVYDRLVSVMKKENDQHICVLEVPPPRMSLGKNPSLEETRKEILENAIKILEKLK